MKTVLKYLNNKEDIWLLVVILAVSLGTFLRFFRIEANMVFHGELGHNYLAIKDLIAQHKLPLVGPPTSHPWLSFGPIFYWFMAPILYFSNYDPRAGAYTFALIGALTIILSYEVLQSLFNRKIAAIASVLLAISPAWLMLARQARFYSLAAILFFPFYYSSVKALQILDNSRGTTSSLRKHIAFAGFFFGLMLNFHFTPIILIPGIFVALFYVRKSLKPEHSLFAVLGFLLANLPQVIHEFSNRFEMTMKLIAWIPYRLASFFGVVGNNTVTSSMLRRNFYSLFEYVHMSTVPPYHRASVIISIAIALFIFSELKRAAKKRKKIGPFFSSYCSYFWAT